MGILNVMKNTQPVWKLMGGVYYVFGNTDLQKRSVLIR